MSTTVHPQHTMIGHLPIWTVTVDEKKIIQSRDFYDIRAAIGDTAFEDGTHTVIVKDGNDVLLKVEVNVKEAQ